MHRALDSFRNSVETVSIFRRRARDGSQVSGQFGCCLPAPKVFAALVDAFEK